MTKEKFIAIAAIITPILVILSFFGGIIKFGVDRNDKSSEVKHEQAKGVSTWEIKLSENPSKNPVPTSTTPNVLVSNKSELPIHNVFIFMTPNGIEKLDSDIELMSVQSAYYHSNTIAPGETEVRVPNLGPAAGQKIPIPMIFFTDSKNNEWLRDTKGNLSPYPNYQDYLSEHGITGPYSN